MTCGIRKFGAGDGRDSCCDGRGGTYAWRHVGGKQLSLRPSVLEQALVLGVNNFMQSVTHMDKSVGK